METEFGNGSIFITIPFFGTWLRLFFGLGSFSLFQVRLFSQDDYCFIFFDVVIFFLHCSFSIEYWTSGEYIRE